MDATVMKAHCDYCRGKLGLLVHRYWHMRFCSSACVQGYVRRLDETKSRIRRLNYSSGGGAAVIDSLPESPVPGPIGGV
jgi:hypothetical protein